MRVTSKPDTFPFGLKHFNHLAREHRPGQRLLAFLCGRGLARILNVVFRNARVRTSDDAKPLNADKAFAYAVRALSQRALTEAELEKKLRARHASPDVIAQTLERLREYRFVDDQSLAERAVKDDQTGSRLIRMKLRQRGLGNAVIEDAMQARDPDADLEAAQRLAERHAHHWTGERGYAKAYAFLSRRGFDARTIQTVLQDLRLNVQDSDQDRDLEMED